MRPGRDAFTQCRVLGHAWWPVPDDAAWSTRRVWRHRLVLACERCGARRLDGIDAQGAVGGRQYDYPEGYSYTRDDTPSRHELRLAMLRPPSERKRPGGDPGAGAGAEPGATPAPGPEAEATPPPGPEAHPAEPEPEAAAADLDARRHHGVRRRAGPRRAARAG